MPSRRGARALLTTAFLVMQAVPGRTLAQEDFVDEPLAKVYWNRYQSSKHWAIRAILLLSLGEVWHDAALPMVTDALLSKDEHLQAFAIEALRSTKPACLRHVASSDLVENLVRKQLKERNELYRTRVSDVLSKIFPDADVGSARDWKSHWSQIKEQYVPAAYTYPEKKPTEAGKSVSGGFIERAFDLNQNGLQVAICIDTTGSMQPTIDAARTGIADIVAMLAGIAPDLTVGIVQYRDFTDFADGGKMILALTRSLPKIQKELDDLRAMGGGDFPERVEVGLEIGLDRRMGWSRRSNKLVLLIGDAPAHPSAQKKAEQLAEEAHTRPFGVQPNEGSSGGGTSTGGVRPFVISTVGVGMTRVNDQTARSLETIAKKGGGAYGTLLTQGHENASVEIIHHVLTNSFGSRYASQTRRFAEVFLEYHHANFF